MEWAGAPHSKSESRPLRALCSPYPIPSYLLTCLLAYLLFRLGLNTPLVDRSLLSGDTVTSVTVIAAITTEVAKQREQLEQVALMMDSLRAGSAETPHHAAWMKSIVFASEFDVIEQPLGVLTVDDVVCSTTGNLHHRLDPHKPMHTCTWGPLIPHAHAHMHMGISHPQ
jgi:hypothetical protein